MTSGLRMHETNTLVLTSGQSPLLALVILWWLRMHEANTEHYHVNSYHTISLGNDQMGVYA